MIARRARAARGFTLLEMSIALAIIAILAAVATPMILNRILEGRINATGEEAQVLYEAMVGREAEQGSFGFVGDIGRLPASFGELAQPSGLPAYTVSTVRGVGMGWKGPYINTGASATDYLTDAFGRPYTGASTGQVRSTGPDGIAGNADDIVYPPAAPVITGRVHVNVKAILEKRTLNDPAGYVVDLYYSNGGVQTVVRDSSPPFRFDDVPAGLHAVQVIGPTGAVAAGETIGLPRGGTRVVELWLPGT
ncbi:MAG: prepilin-type N-terminal cleavage/methylation domain-containing protein [Vicinamibacterales bacterium]